MVPYHDLHHLLTGYRMNVAGEIELGTWEMATRYNGTLRGWQLKSGAVAAGALAMPRRTWRAFLRGRRGRSLYGLPLEEVLDRSIDEVRRYVDPDTQGARVRFSDVLSFAATVAGGMVVVAVALPLVVLLTPFGMLAAWRHASES